MPHKVVLKFQASPVPYHTMAVEYVEGTGETIEAAADDAVKNLDIAWTKLFTGMLEEAIESCALSEHLKKGGRVFITREGGSLQVKKV